MPARRLGLSEREEEEMLSCRLVAAACCLSRGADHGCLFLTASSLSRLRSLDAVSCDVES